MPTWWKLLCSPTRSLFVSGPAEHCQSLWIPADGVTEEKDEDMLLQGRAARKMASSHSFCPWIHGTSANLDISINYMKEWDDGVVLSNCAHILRLTGGESEEDRNCLALEVAEDDVHSGEGLPNWIWSVFRMSSSFWSICVTCSEPKHTGYHLIIYLIAHL